MKKPQGYDEAKAYDDHVLRSTGQALAAQMPKFYGKVTFNLQGGRCKGGVFISDDDHVKVERSVR